jgi:hypothetical protein
MAVSKLALFHAGIAFGEAQSKIKRKLEAKIGIERR